MLPERIKFEIEHSPLIEPIISRQKDSTDWSTFTRTTFMNIAKQINRKVTEDVIKAPFLIEDNVLVGTNELDRVFSRNSLNTIAEFTSFLKHIPKYRTYNWISGKTLQSYWLGETVPKDKKINVLLTFLGVDYNKWEEWKSDKQPIDSTPVVGNKSTDLIRKYYLGSYFRYYQKPDKSGHVIKVPFTIFENADKQIIAKSKTVGHSYISDSIWLEDGALYIVMKNINFNEYEFHVLNVGFSTTPQLLMGTSSSLNNKKEAISKKNILIREEEVIDFDATCEEVIKGSEPEGESIDGLIFNYFNKNIGSNLIHTQLAHRVDDL